MIIIILVFVLALIFCYLHFHSGFVDKIHFWVPVCSIFNWRLLLLYFILILSWYYNKFLHRRASSKSLAQVQWFLIGCILIYSSLWELFFPLFFRSLMFFGSSHQKHIHITVERNVFKVYKLHNGTKLNGKKGWGMWSRIWLMTEALFLPFPLKQAFLEEVK